MAVIETNTNASKSTEVNDSTATSINGSTATNETTTNTEISSSTDEKNAPAVATIPKAISAPPKINPWKARAEQTQGAKLPDSQKLANEGTDSSHSQTESSMTPNNVESSLQNTQNQKRGHRVSRSSVIDDTTLWPTLDKALGEVHEASARKQANGTEGEHGIPSAPKVTGKEKWTKYTPTITYTPIPSKSARGGASASKTSARTGSSQRPSREKTSIDKNEAGADSRTKTTRSSDTSRSRTSKTRSMSVSNTRSERQPRRESQVERDQDLSQTAGRSQSTKRSERGSISVPNGGTPVSDASKSPQVGSVSGNANDSTSANTSEARLHRGSYDSNFSHRGRGGYRGTRAGYQNNFGNGRYQNPNYSAQPQLHGSRAFPRDQMTYNFDQYQNFVNPAIAPVMIDPIVARHMILNQCEYYFSIENLCKDLFLRKHMDEQGFVNLPILAKFNRVRAITLDYALIRDVCVMSSIIELRAAPGAYDKIRRAEGWEQWVLPEEQRDPSTKDVPELVPEVPTTVTNEDTPTDMSSSIGAPSFVPGQSATEAQQTATSVLTENFAHLGMGRKLSPDVKEFQSAKDVK